MLQKLEAFITTRVQTELPRQVILNLETKQVNVLDPVISPREI